MKLLNSATLKLTDLRLPGDMEERKRSPHVRELAASIGTLGLLQLPLVEGGTKRLIAGADRVAAHMLRGDTHIEVRLCVGSAEELEEATIVENLLRRRDDEVELRRRLVEIRAKSIEEQRKAQLNQAPDVNAQRGRPASALGEAREQIAKELGISKQALVQADFEARERESAEAAAAAEGSDLAADEEAPEQRINTLGLVGPQVRLALDGAESLFEEAAAIAAAFQKIRGSLKRLCDKGVFIDEEADVITKEIKVLVWKFSDVAPVAICTWCKLAPQLWNACNYCNGVGLIGKRAFERTPPDLLVGGADAAVPIKGRNVKLSTLTKGNAKPSVEDDDATTESADADQLPF